MTSQELAAIHASAMVVPPPWSARTIEGFLEAPGAILATSSDGFALGRVIADEAELLTLAVAPEARRQGQAARCLAAFTKKALQGGAERIFLEVAANNKAARALYTKAGFREEGQRRGYYKAENGQPVDAIVMSKTLPPA